MATLVRTHRAPFAVPWRALALGGTALALLAALLSRRPDALSHPSFYAEDGANFYSDAHNAPGVGTVLLPLGGYLVVFQRVVGALLAPLGLSDAAVAMVLVACIVQLLPALFFMSSRCRNLVGGDRLRIAIGVAYVLIPNAELTGVLTNTQWHLAVLAFLFIVAEPARSRAGRAVEMLAIAVAGLTGPYSILLLPIAFILHRSSTDTWRRVQLCVLGATALTQLGVMAAQASAHPRGVLPLGISAWDSVFILPNQVLVRMLTTTAQLTSWPSALMLSILIAAVLVAGTRSGSRELRCFVVFAMAVAALGLVFPYGAIPKGQTWWHTAASGEGGTRYFFLLCVALVLCAVALMRWLPGARSRIPVVAATAGFVLLGAAIQWQYPTLPDQHLAAVQHQLDGARAGTTITVPIAPSKWSMRVDAR